MTFLYICKSQKEKRGEEREGSYAARAQIGTEKDGSPMYRYFDTVEQYKNYIDKKNKKPKKDKDTPSDKEDDKESLKEKTAKEHKQSTEKHRAAQREAKEKQSFGKSVTLYIKVST